MKTESNRKAVLKSPLNNFIIDKNGVYINPESGKEFNYSDGQQSEDYVFNTLNSVEDLTIYSDQLREKIQ